MQKSLVMGAVCATFFMSGCAGGGFEPVTGFQSVTGTSVDLNLRQQTSDFKRDAATGNGFAYTAGVQVESREQQAVMGVGLLPGTDVTAPPSTGFAVYRTEFEYLRLQSSDGFKTGPIFKGQGRLNLNADFGNGTLKGSVLGGSGSFTVDGKFTGKDLTGTVTVAPTTASNVTAELKGLMGANQTVGVFHGKAGNSAVVGGFIGTK